jgi:hypothetical protein
MPPSGPGFDERLGNVLVRGDSTAISELQNVGNSAFAGSVENFNSIEAAVIFASVTCRADSSHPRIKIREEEWG